MKRIGRRLLSWYLGSLARVVLARRRPLIIAIAGTVNKGFVKEAIFNKLTAAGISAEAASRSFNTAIGLPLAILGLESGYESYRRWLSIITQAAVRVFKRRLPGVLVLELGISHPGDLKRLLSLIRPQVGIITDITQRYRENFSNLEAIAAEYAPLLQSLPTTGLAVLNYDTMVVRNLASSSAAPVVFVSRNDPHESSLRPGDHHILADSISRHVASYLQSTAGSR